MRLFGFLFMLLLLCNANDAFQRIYETARKANDTSGLAFHCLYKLYIAPFSEQMDKWRMTGRIQMLHYCRRTTAKKSNNVLVSNTKVLNGKEFTFDRLREMNISAQQLFDWYAPMDTIEEYILGKSTGLFYNCSRTKGNYWFGPSCQYKFDLRKDFIENLNDQLIRKTFVDYDILSFTNGTCYPMNDGECQSILCLDWREICDGKIDCTNGLDEHRCHELEMNDCDKVNEYRCLNGQCIDKVFYWNGFYDCMDESDERAEKHGKDCYDLFNSNCEDRSCPYMRFSCGDGHCYDGPNVDHDEACKSQRDRLYLKQMPPSTFILFSHVSLIYNGTQPNWICYNGTLCPYLSNYAPALLNTFVLNGSTCRAWSTFTNQTYPSSYDTIKDFKRFVRSCSIPPRIGSPNHCSLFQCDDKSKCVSFHRLSDGYKDCSNGEDERQNNTCSLDLPHRHTCDMGTRCIHQSTIADGTVHCDDKSDEYEHYFSLCYIMDDADCQAHRRVPLRFNVTFTKICNGIVEDVADVFNNTDETDCLMSEWHCITEASKCNGVWNCPDGRDELDCPSDIPKIRYCDNHTQFCLHRTTGLATCLSLPQVGDNIIDCVGSIDERAFCRTTYPNEITRRYRCRNSDQCISPLQVCDSYQDCPENDDETTACVWLNNGQEPFYHPGVFRCRDGKELNCNGETCHCRRGYGTCTNGEQELFCDLVDHTLTSSKYSDGWQEYSNTGKNQLSRSLPTASGFTDWYCHRGLFVRSNEDLPGFYCFCPDYYYGDRCQYQRKRVSITLQLQIRESFNHFLPIFKIVVLLIRQNISSIIILSHDQFIYAPHRDCLQTYLTHLLYPMNETYSPTFNHSVHVHAFIAQILEHRVSWKFVVPFDFLPVSRIAKQLSVSSNTTATGPSSIIMSSNNCTTCFNNALCFGYDVNLGRDICVCPLNYTGSHCIISFNPCTKNSCNGHGQCIPIDERYDVERQFICMCDVEWIGQRCEYFASRIHVSFAADIPIPLSNIAFVHIIYTAIRPIHLINFYRVHQVMPEFTVFLDENNHEFELIFIQLYEHRAQFEYYLLLARNVTYYHDRTEISRQVQASNRCQSIHELFNATVIAQPQLRRVKNYQQPCRDRVSEEKLKCFYDDELMCICDRTNYASCFNLDSSSFGCPWNTCSNRGTCVQNHEVCPTSALCICEPCTYGSICQFSTAGYSFSLDAILGSHIRMSSNIFHQTEVIKISVAILSIMVISGIILDILTIGTFSQKTTQDVGCGLYLLVTSCLGLSTMIILTCKMILLINTEQRNVSCALVEFLLKWWPTSSEWLNACVAIDRTLAVVRQTQYSASASRRQAKWIVVSILLLIGLLSSPELIYRRTMIDTRDERTWCVFTLNADRQILHTLYSVLNILLFLIPLTINLVSPVVIILGTLRSKQKSCAVRNIPLKKVNKKDTSTANDKTKPNIQVKTQFDGIKEQILKYKHILMGPILLSILSLPRLVLAFIFVCTKLDRVPFGSLFIYLIGFLPSMVVFFAYVLPSQTYRTAFYSFIKQIMPRSIGTWFDAYHHRV